MKKILPLMLIAFAVIACSSCAQQPRPTPPPAPSPVEVVDAGPAPVFDAAPPVSGDVCAAAEAKAAALNCPLAPTTKGDSWATVCRAYTMNGIDMHAACVAKSSDCKAISVCLGR